jgi:phenylalanyl-tRNA synthetase alpha subunit
MASHGLPVLLDNMQFRGIEMLKDKTDEFMQKLEEMQQKQQQMPNPEQIKMQIEQMKLQQKQQKDAIENRIAAAEIELEKQKIQVNLAQIMADLEETRMKSALDKEKYHSENQRKAAEMVMQASHQAGKMSIEQRKLEHALSEPREPVEIAGQGL